MIKLIISILMLTSCSNLRDKTITDNDFVIRENNSAKPIEFHNK